MKSLMNSSLGRHIRATARERLIRDLKRERPFNGISRFNTEIDLSCQEHYARIFFTKCQFPLVCQRSYELRSTLEKRSITQSGQIEGNLVLIRSLARYSFLVLKYRKIVCVMAKYLTRSMKSKASRRIKTL